MKLPKYLARGLLPLVAVLVNAVPAMAGSGWTEYVYNASGQALMPQAPAVSDNTATITFSPGVFVAALTTTDTSLTGDLSQATLTDTITVSDMDAGAVFVDQNSGGCVPDNHYVRFFLTSPAASGPGFPGPGKPANVGLGSVPAGFYTQSWWSNPISLQLTNNVSGSITVQVSDDTLWSDWNGIRANNPAVTSDFESAISHVQSVGLSFGGGCFFENGVSVSEGTGTLASVFSESS